MKNQETLVDHQIQRLLKKRDGEAIRLILEHYGNYMKTIIWHHLYGKAEADCEECINDTLLDIWNHYDQFDPEKGNLRNWICGIAKFNALDVLRREKRRWQTYDIDDVTINIQISDEIDVIEQELLEETEASLAVLNEMDRSIIQMYYLQQIGIKEISQKLGLSEASTYKRMERSIKRLRKTLHVK